MMMEHVGWNDVLAMAQDIGQGWKRAQRLAELHKANPGMDRSAELDILAMTAHGWLY